MFPNQVHQPRQRPRSMWDKIWKDRRGHIVIYQRPNLLLIAWAVLSIISLLASSQTVANIFWWIGSAVLAVWALLEIATGVNYFRRGLGAVVLLFTVAGAFGIGL